MCRPQFEGLSVWVPALNVADTAPAPSGSALEASQALGDFGRRSECMLPSRASTGISVTFGDSSSFDRHGAAGSLAGREPYPSNTQISSEDHLPAGHRVGNGEAITVRTWPSRRILVPAEHLRPESARGQASETTRRLRDSLDCVLKSVERRLAQVVITAARSSKRSSTGGSAWSGFRRVALRWLLRGGGGAALPAELRSGRATRRSPNASIVPARLPSFERMRCASVSSAARSYHVRNSFPGAGPCRDGIGRFAGGTLS